MKLRRDKSLLFSANSYLADNYGILFRAQHVTGRKNLSPFSCPNGFCCMFCKRFRRQRVQLGTLCCQRHYYSYGRRTRQRHICDTIVSSKERLSSEAIPKNGDVIIEKPSRNQRTIISGLLICAEMKSVWDLLTDYEHLADFIPNLAVSKLRYHPQGGIRLEQEGFQAVLGFRFRASVTLDMYESYSDDKAEIGFSLAESQDFDVFEGSWLMYPWKRSWTHLIYQVTVQPKRFVPVQAVEWRIREDVPANLRSIKNYIENLSRRKG